MRFLYNMKALGIGGFPAVVRMAFTFKHCAVAQTKGMRGCGFGTSCEKLGFQQRRSTEPR